MIETRTTCDNCGLSYLYDPKYHECQDPAVLANLPTTTWVEECMAKQTWKCGIVR